MTKTELLARLAEHRKTETDKLSNLKRFCSWCSVGYTGFSCPLCAAKQKISQLETFAASLLSLESPIEKKFYTSFMDINPDGVYIEPQKQIDHCRVDFLLTHADKSLVVECDGYEYHHSKEQMQKDRSRDRHLMSVGYNVVRFLGCEINASPSNCVNQCLRLLGVV